MYFGKTEEEILERTSWRLYEIFGYVPLWWRKPLNANI